VNKSIVLVNFYSPKSLGIRYLEGALAGAGFDVTVIYFKGFHSIRPRPPVQSEIDELIALLREKDPLLIGFSVMSSLYLEAVELVGAAVRGKVKAPVVWGGVYATIFPERCLAHCDYVLRGECEGALTELAARLSQGASTDDLENLAYTRGGETVVNPVRPLETDLDSLKMAPIGLNNKYFIDGGVRVADPMLSSYSYETSCSRGCPFVCAYCSTVNIKRIYRDNRRFLRFRSAGSVIEELKTAKAKIRGLAVIHFWDEIFSSDAEWIAEFSERYRKEVGLPFDIWAHPLKTSPEIMKTLRKAGLYQVVMGIQSGSPEVRKSAFHRTESQEQILAAAQAIAEAGVPRVIYDLILRHPFETTAQIRESYELCDKLPGRFTLQLHDLNFLPGTDIAEEAVKRGIYTPEQMEAMMYAPMEKQYATWWETGSDDKDVNFWYHLIYLTQFPLFKGAARRLARGMDAGKPEVYAKAERCYGRGKRLARLRHYWQKGKAVLLGKIKR
jgi:radical SAM superfamily enzyme YgiQ (UPF0313 family)